MQKLEEILELDGIQVVVIGSNNDPEFQAFSKDIEDIRSATGETVEFFMLSPESETGFDISCYKDGELIQASKNLQSWEYYPMRNIGYSPDIKNRLLSLLELHS